MAERYKARVCDRSLAGVANSNPTGGIEVCVVSGEKKAKCGTIKTKKQVRMKYKHSTKNTKQKKSPCGRNLPHPSRPFVGHTQPATYWVPGLFPGGKAAGVWRRPPSSTEIKRVYTSTPSLGLHGLY